LGRKERGSLEETAYALVVPNEEYLGMKLSENNEKIQEIMAKEIKEVNMRLATYKHIHGFELRPELPKTATRKVKKELVKKTLSGQPI
jgi:acyl-coenzyme A synthetase/AMP-(fatty) acid ligase